MRELSHPRVRRPTPATTLLTAAGVSYLTNCALGMAVASRLLDTSEFRWVHHALYVATSTLTAVATASLLCSRNRAGLLLLPAGVPLVLISRVRTHSPWHAVTALSAAPFFLAAVGEARR